MATIEEELFKKCQNRSAPKEDETERQLYDDVNETIPPIKSKNGATLPHHAVVATLHR